VAAGRLCGRTCLSDGENLTGHTVGGGYGIDRLQVTANGRQHGFREGLRIGILAARNFLAQQLQRGPMSRDLPLM
jgi:hypothetical protein